MALRLGPVSGLAWTAAALLAAGCAGAIGDGTSDPAGDPAAAAAPGMTGMTGMATPGQPAPSGTPPPPGTPPKPPAAGPLEDRPGPMPLRRLSRDELNNTLRDLLGDTSSPARVLPPEGHGVHGFVEAGAVSAVDAEYLLEVVEKTVATAVRRLPTLIGCDPAASGEEACVQRFVTRFGRRAFRRPVASDEAARYVEYYRSVKTAFGYPFLEGARMVLQAMLLAPSFLYHWELGPQPATAQGGLVRLTPHEIAARLSYFLWASMPDDPLFGAADGGRLGTEADVEREARRLLGDAKARPTIASFHAQWLHLEKLFDTQKEPRAYSIWTAELARAMFDETAGFVTRVTLDGAGGTLQDLLTSTASQANVVLARVYGVTGPMDRTFVPVQLDPTQRAGLFTQASFLTVNATALGSHPVKRGHKIYQDVLCGAITSPPDMVPPAGVPPPNLSTRELFEAHARNACAVACHGRIDPPGFAFEHYDAIGRFRTMDGGKPVNASGTLQPPSGGAGMPFKNAIDFVGALATLEDVQRCMAKQWFRFALGRGEGDGDAASLESAFQVFKRSGFKLRELLLGLATARAFHFRAAAAGEVLR